MKKYTSFEITMALVNAGCDLRKLDPEIIKLIEAAGSEYNKEEPQQTATPENPYVELSGLIARILNKNPNDYYLSKLSDAVLEKDDRLIVDRYKRVMLSPGRYDQDELARLSELITTIN